MGRGLFEGWHLILLLVIVFLLFGASRLPGVAKSLGESLKIFKKEMKDLSDDGKSDAATPPAPSSPAATSSSSTSTPPTADGTIPGIIDQKQPGA